MVQLTNKIDFIVMVQVKGANPNGDPLADNYPRTDIYGYGLMSDVSIKRKIRNRMQDYGHEIFVKAQERTDDGCMSLQERYEAHFGKDKKSRDEFSIQEMHDSFCKTWLDTRALGQVVTYDNRSIGIRGPLSISIAKSLSPVDIVSMQITRSTESMGKSDTMGSKQFVDFGVYMIKGSINPYFAEKTGFTQADAEVIKECLTTLFVNDSSSARPDGSMEVKDIFWFTHPSKLGLVSSAKIFDLLEYESLKTLDVVSYEDYKIHLNQEKLDDLIARGLIIDYPEAL